MSATSVTKIILGTAAGAALLTAIGCGSGGIDGFTPGDYIAPPLGPTTQLYNENTGGWYVAEVKPNIDEHNGDIDDPFFFYSAYNFAPGNTHWVYFDTSNTTTNLWSASALSFANSGGGNEQPVFLTTEEGQLEYEALFPYVHQRYWTGQGGTRGDYIIETFFPMSSNDEHWQYVEEWQAIINPTVDVDLRLTSLAYDASYSGEPVPGGNLNGGISIIWFGLDENLRTSGNSTLARIEWKLHPRPGPTQLSPYSGLYSVAGEYEPYAGGGRTPATIQLAMSDNGLITTSIANTNLAPIGGPVFSTPFFAFLDSGFLGTVITAQRSGPAVAYFVTHHPLNVPSYKVHPYPWISKPTFHWYQPSIYWGNSYWTSFVNPAAPPFSTTVTLDFYDRVTQRWQLTVSIGQQKIIGGDFQQSVNRYDPDAWLPTAGLPYDRNGADRTAILGQKFYIMSTNKM